MAADSITPESASRVRVVRSSAKNGVIAASTLIKVGSIQEEQIANELFREPWSILELAD